MAQELEAYQKLEEQLNCSICLDTYTDPKQLQCHHIFCQKCLVKLVVRDEHGQFVLTCPICRQDTPVPANGVVGLQPAFNIVPFLEIQDSFKKIETAPKLCPKPAAELEANGAGPSLNKCSTHADKEMELYCETCGELICWKCIAKSGKHHSHDYEEIEKAFDNYKSEIASSLEPMEKQLATINESLAQFDIFSQKISDQQTSIGKNIHSTFTQLHEMLEIRKTKLMNQLDQLTRKINKDLAVQRDQIETAQARLSSCLCVIRESLKTSNEINVLLMKPTIVKQVRELTTTFQPHVLEPEIDSKIVFSASKEIFRPKIELLASKPDPSYCYATVMDVSVEAGKKCTAVVAAVDSSGRCAEPSTSLECELVSEITGIKTRDRVEKTGKSHYTISFQPNMKGGHQLHIKMEGQHIQGSPYSLTAKLPIAKLGTPFQIMGMGGPREPQGIVINQRGKLVVTEWSSSCVSVFSPIGRRIGSFGTYGKGPGQFISPLGVTVDGEGNIFVVDFDCHRIQKFTAEGKFLKSVGSKGNGPLRFFHPHFIAFNASNNRLYVEDDNHHVQILNSDLSFCGSFGKRGNNKGQFNCPNCVACDSTGKVYVADRNNHRIQIFTARGEFLRMFGTYGDGKGELCHPSSVAIDCNGNIYVSEDGVTHRISVFTSEGQFVTSFGRRGVVKTDLCAPRGVAVNKDGVVYVCDHGNSCIQVF